MEQNKNVAEKTAPTVEQPNTDILESKQMEKIVNATEKYDNEIQSENKELLYNAFRALDCLSSISNELTIIEMLERFPEKEGYIKHIEMEYYEPKTSAILKRKLIAITPNQLPIFLPFISTEDAKLFLHMAHKAGWLTQHYFGGGYEHIYYTCLK